MTFNRQFSLPSNEVVAGPPIPQLWHLIREVAERRVLILEQLLQILMLQPEVEEEEEVARLKGDLSNLLPEVEEVVILRGDLSNLLPEVEEVEEVVILRGDLSNLLPEVEEVEEVVVVLIEDQILPVARMAIEYSPLRPQGAVGK